MLTLPPNESHILQTLALARQQPDVQAIYRALIVWAAWQISAGNTQEGGDVLAFLRRQSLEAALRIVADELWEELTSRACPRVIHDAQDFGAKATLEDVLDYVEG